MESTLQITGQRTYRRRRPSRHASAQMRRSSSNSTIASRAAGWWWRFRTGANNRDDAAGVRIDLTVPGEEIVIGREPGHDHAHEDVYVAIRDAFDAAKRQLQDHARRGARRRPSITTRRPKGASPGSSATWGYGFIETPEGREVYFHRNSVLDDGFDRLAAGMPVRFVEELGEKGPQATTVRPGRRRAGAKGQAEPPP